MIVAISRGAMTATTKRVYERTGSGRTWAERRAARRRVPNDVFRERATELIGRGATWSELTDRMGWQRRRGGKANITKFKVMLGITPERAHVQTTVQYATALRLLDALLLDPVDADL